ncbi:hypothetical protein GPLA_4455 [Paraglaciecola polaris LMG 21857]|uniref:Uncharacterized protein n=1 Tax=Paraglaciecola polaris LMG 21857 TaxID=1129793 RepID=K6YRJ9_9ALTE|nr:hypothetical protein GPLA_4455 [Paraglaciecola polaris LMG 21857]
MTIFIHNTSLMTLITTSRALIAQKQNLLKPKQINLNGK